ncbi:unnamed protein product [Schistocephalus solidus]|uniref:Integrase_H2C2 domain-containing protein n=1 Tax=Schistocephalus solidus TaxID=70667 RepID=A0A183SWH8_SCHSO|nr:unnamed protein product [Schistocephalus solidus]
MKYEMAGMLLRLSLSAFNRSHGIDLGAIAAEKRCAGCPVDESFSFLHFADVPSTTCTGTIICVVSTPFHRPLAPASMRRAAFKTVHVLSYPKIRASQMLLTERFSWPGLKKDAKSWTCSCLYCQRDKVQRHKKPPLLMIRLGVMAQAVWGYRG